MRMVPMSRWSRARRVDSTRAAAPTLVAVLALAGCAGTAPNDGPAAGPEVLASVYPLQYAVERVGGTSVDVRLLTPPGAEPHVLELSPAQVRTVGEADLVVYVSGFQAAVDQAVAARRPAHVVDAVDSGVVDRPAAETGDHAGGAIDPHFWLDPTRLAVVGTEIADELAAIDPDHAGDYARGAAELTAELDALDQEFEDGLARCESDVIVTTHAAFGYLTDRYGLEQVSIAGIEPETEPSPARLREVARAVEDTGVTTIFTEVLVSPKVADVLAGDHGLGTAVLDPLGGQTDQADDYVDVMRSNLETLRAALRCA
jgi:zinc transport system substrate-binding protein